MNKSSLEKLLKTDAHYSTDLVSLDFKSESLNRFLQNVVNIVNQHSSKLNSLQMNKMTIDQVRLGNIQLFNASKMSPNIIQELPVISVNEKQQTYKDTVQGLSAHLTQHSHGFQHLLDVIKKQNHKIDGLANALSTFQTAQNSKQLFRKANAQNKKLTEDEFGKLSTRLKDLQMNTSKQLNSFQNLTKQIQKKTLWKISQCQQSLLKKITPQYVEKALQQYQSKILFKVEQNKAKSLAELKFLTQNLKSKLDTLASQCEQNQNQNKRSIKELTQNVKNFENKEKVQRDFKEVETKFKQMLIKMDKLEKREHPQDLEFRIMKIATQQGEKLNTHHNKLKKLEIQLDSINSVMSSMGTGSGGMTGDPHKLCQLDGQIRKLRDSNRTIQTNLLSVQNQLRTKLLVFEQRIMTTLSMIKGQDHFVSREELYQSITRLRQPINQRMNQNNNLINQLNSKTSKLQMFEKSTKKKIKEMTKGDQLNKILDLKMNIGTAQSHFNAVNMKLQALQIIMNKIKMEMENNADFLKMLQNQINQPEEGFNVLGPKTKVFPAKCVGCGVKHIPSYENNMMRGSDGKLYKVDMKSYHNSDLRQVYGVTQSQIATFDSSMKRTVRTTSTCGKTTSIRPSSSKNY